MSAVKAPPGSHAGGSLLLLEDSTKLDWSAGLRGTRQNSTEVLRVGGLA